MEYYNPIDNSSKWYAAIVTLIVMAIIAVVVSYISLEVEIRRAELYAVEIEYIELEEEEPVEPETKLKSTIRTKQTYNSALLHFNADTVNNVSFTICFY